MSSSRVRLWPGVVLVALQWLLWLVAPAVVPETRVVVLGLYAGIVGGLLVLLWWAFFSRTPHVERWGAILLLIAAVFAARRLLDDSMATAGMGVLFFAYLIPALSFALVLAAAIGSRLGPGLRRATLAAAILIACGLFVALRTEGVTGAFRSQLAWRWTKTPEQRLLAQAAAEPVPVPAAAPATTPEAPTVAPPVVASRPPVAAPAATPWPGFRGPHRDGRVPKLRIRTDWAAAPPVELWRRPIGPGWSSFAVGDGFLYTQEQRGDSEVVACYRTATGEPVWTRRDAARFWESNAGAGPRGTPTLNGGRIYALGATGILNALDARTGAVVWTRNVASDAAVKVPGWGFSGSPLVVGDAVIVAASGRLAAYGLATGEPRWLGSDGGEGYSSPQLLEIGGVEQVVFLSGSGVAGVAPSDGKALWSHKWKGFASLQPAVSADGAVLVAMGTDGGGQGIRRLAVARGANGWTADEMWTSTGLKPYFNDFVVHNGHAFGFDGSILSCIDLQDGKRKWKGGRYGYGQLLLLSDQDLLLVLSEEGELVLVSAKPDQFAEVAKIPALEGKTWNHPAIAGDILLVRNGREMVAFRLPRAET